MTDNHSSLAEQAASTFGFTLSDAQAAAFATYARLLVEWNTRMNLTAIDDEAGIQTRHFLDSLSVMTVLPPGDNLSLIDVGTGAGFPGLPLKILMPSLRLTLMEATGKKLTFLQAVCDALEITGVTMLHARAELAGQMDEHREQYHVVVARAVARLPVLAEFLLPLAQRGGVAIAMKGRTAHDEADAAGASIRKMGGRLNRIESVTLPGLEEPHYLIVMDKLTPTPPAFPRRPGDPRLRPL